MWGAGLDPYGPGFLAAGAGLLAPDATVFAYPPNWWIIAVPLAALKTGSAVLAWKLLNLAAAAAACALLVRSAARLAAGRWLWPACLFILCAFTSDIMENVLRLGQTGLFVLLGFALLIAGLTDNRRPTQVAGLAVLLLKPPIGLLFLALMATRRETRAAAGLALLVTAIACLPLLFTLGFGATVESARNLLQNLQLYGQSPWNWPIHNSGLPHLFAYLGIGIPAVAALVAAWATAELLLRRSPEAERDRFVVSFWMVSVAALLSMAQLHAYDFILFFTCLLLLPLLGKGPSRNLLLLSLVLTWSAPGLAKMAFLAEPSMDGFWMATRLKSDLLTAGGIALLAAAVFHLRSRPDAVAAGNDNLLSARHAPGP
nr:glycosyltransferase 87 family protein [Sphingomonas sp.]